MHRTWKHRTFLRLVLVALVAAVGLLPAVAGKVLRDDGTEVDWNPPPASPWSSDGTGRRAGKDQEVRAELVFAMDTSGSMSDEFTTLCSRIGQIVQGVRDAGIDADYRILGIAATYHCAKETVPEVVRHQGGRPTVDHIEDWGPAVVDLSRYYPWPPGRVRLVLPLSDESAQNGGDWWDDQDEAAADAAIAAATDESVLIMPILCSGYNSGMVQAADRMARATHGRYFLSSQPDQDLIDGIVDAILDAVGSVQLTGIQPYWYVDAAWRDPGHTRVNKLPGDVIRLVGRVDNPTENGVTARLTFEFPSRWTLSPGPDGQAVHQRQASWDSDQPVAPASVTIEEGRVVVSGLAVPAASGDEPGHSDEITVDLVIPTDYPQGNVPDVRIRSEWDSTADPDGPRFEQQEATIGTIRVTSHLSRMIVTNRTLLFREYGTGLGDDSSDNDHVANALASLHELAANQDAYLFYLDAWDDHDNFSGHNPTCAAVSANPAYCTDDAPLRTWDREQYYDCHTADDPPPTRNRYRCDKYQQFEDGEFTEDQLNAVAILVDDYIRYWTTRTTGPDHDTWVLFVGDDRIVPFFRLKSHDKDVKTYYWAHYASAHTIALARHGLLWSHNPYTDFGGRSWDPRDADRLYPGRLVAWDAKRLDDMMTRLVSWYRSSYHLNVRTATLTSGYDPKWSLLTYLFRDDLLDHVTPPIGAAGVQIACDSARSCTRTCKEGSGGDGCLLEHGTSQHWYWSDLEPAIGGITAYSDHGWPDSVQNFRAAALRLCTASGGCLMAGPGEGPPALQLWTCLSGLADGGDEKTEGFAFRVISSGFSTFVASTTMTSQHQQMRLAGHFYEYLLGKSGSETEPSVPPESIGRALVMANKESLWRWWDFPKNRSSSMGYVLYGIPWTIYNPVAKSAPGMPGESAAVESVPLGQNIVRVDGAAKGTGTLVASEDLTVPPDAGSVAPLDQFQLLEIPGFSQWRTDGLPVVPFRPLAFTLPADAVVHAVSIEASEADDLGEVHLPAYQDVVRPPAADSPPIYVEPDPALGFFDPISNPYWHQVREGNVTRVFVDAIPVTFDTATRATTLYHHLVIHVEYETSRDGVLLAGAPKRALVDAGSSVVVRWVPVNTSAEERLFTATIHVYDTLGREVATAHDSATLPSAHAESRDVPVGEISSPGTYFATVEAEGDSGTIGSARHQFRVIAGEITAFDVPNPARPGEQARFTIHFVNRGGEPLEGTYKVLVYRGTSLLGETVPVVETTRPGDTSVIPFYWDVPAGTTGEHRAVAVVEFGDTSDTMTAAFVVGENQPPVADAGPDREAECEGPEGTNFALDGSGSSDPDGDDLTCQWSSADCTIADPGRCATTATCPRGRNTVTLVVNDGQVDSAPDEAVLTVVDTTPPKGEITYPPEGACLPPAVTVTDDFTDICDDELHRTWEPGPGPVYDRDGLWDVVLTVEDDAGNTASDEVSFIVDGTPPVVTLLDLPAMEQSVPREEPFARYFATSDEDDAPGGVVHERIYVNGCLVFDGDNYGNGDGLLTDETVEVPVGLLCHAYRACGWTELTDPVIRIEADDCAGNTGHLEVPYQGHWVVDVDVCNGK